MQCSNSLIQWGNMWIYDQVAPQQSLWMFDHTVRVGNQDLLAVESLGMSRARLTKQLWQKLGLCKQYSNGWLLSNQQMPAKLPASVASKDTSRCILARTIMPAILQCTVGRDIQVIKETTFHIGEGGRCPITEHQTVFPLAETRERSQAIARELQGLCNDYECVLFDGIRISWGFTVDGVLTPVGGFGLPDHSRYELVVSSKERSPFDRRVAKQVFQEAGLDTKKLTPAAMNRISETYRRSFQSLMLMAQ